MVFRIANHRRASLRETATRSTIKLRGLFLGNCVSGAWGCTGVSWCTRNRVSIAAESRRSGLHRLSRNTVQVRGGGGGGSTYSKERVSQIAFSFFISLFNSVTSDTATPTSTKSSLLSPESRRCISSRRDSARPKERRREVRSVTFAQYQYVRCRYVDSFGNNRNCSFRKQ